MHNATRAECDRWPAKTQQRLIFCRLKPEVPAGGHRDSLVVEGIVELWKLLILQARCLVVLRYAVHVERLAQKYLRNKARCDIRHCRIRALAPWYLRQEILGLPIQGVDQMTNQTTKKPIKDLVEKKDATNSELKSGELDEVSGGLINTGGLTAIGGIASKPVTQLTDE
jgi:hypothetical protein